MGRVSAHKMDRMFADVDMMKARLREGASHSFNVTELYQETGYAQMIARHWRFDAASQVFVIFSALWLWIDVDYNNAVGVLDAEWPFFAIDNFLCAVFFWEWLVRYLAFAKSTDCLQDSFFMFDTLLVALNIFETWLVALYCLLFSHKSGAGSGTSLLRLVRLVRLCRMGRMARFLRLIP